MSVHAESAEQPGRSSGRKSDHAGDRESTIVGLDLLRAVGWLVLHDVAVPGDLDLPVDHVVAGPSGVYIINTVGGAGPVRITESNLICGASSQMSEVRELATAAIALRELLNGPPVAPILCFRRTEEVAGVVTDVAICSTENILELLNGQPDVLDAAGTQDVMSLLTATLERQIIRTAPEPEPVLAEKPKHRHHGRSRKLFFGKSAEQVEPVVEPGAEVAEVVAHVEVVPEVVEPEAVEPEVVVDLAPAVEQLTEPVADVPVEEPRARKRFGFRRATESEQAATEQAAPEVDVEDVVEAAAEDAVLEAAVVHALAVELPAIETPVAGLPVVEASPVVADVPEPARKRFPSFRKSTGPVEPVAPEDAEIAAVVAEAAKVDLPVVDVPVDLAPVVQIAVPTAAKPAVFMPSVVKPSVVKPAAVAPAPARPVRPSVTKPLVQKPTMLKPVVAEPVTLEPAVVEPEVEPEVEPVIEPVVKVKAQDLRRKVGPKPVLPVVPEAEAAPQAPELPKAELAQAALPETKPETKPEPVAEAAPEAAPEPAVELAVEPAIEALVPQEPFRPVTTQRRPVAERMWTPAPAAPTSEEGVDPSAPPVGTSAWRVDAKSAIAMVRAAFARRDEEPEFDVAELESTLVEEAPTRALPAWFAPEASPAKTREVAMPPAARSVEKIPRVRAQSLVPMLIGALVIVAALGAAPRIPDAYHWVRSFFVAPPPADFGQTVTIADTGTHPGLAVSAGVPVNVTSSVSAGKGKHWVGVPIRTTSQGSTQWTLQVAKDFQVIDTLGITHSAAATVTKVDAGKVLPRRVALQPGQPVFGMVVVAIPNGRDVRSVQLNLEPGENPSVWQSASSN